MGGGADERGIMGHIDGAMGGQIYETEQLVQAVHESLRRIARRRFRERYGSRADRLTIQPTMIANDVLVELGNQRVNWQNSDQFFAIAARIMLRILTDYERARLAKKRGGGARGKALNDEVVGADGDPAAGALRDEAKSGLLRAMESLHEEHPRRAEVATLHAILEMPLPKVADSLGISLATAERDWKRAKEWLAKEMGGDGE